MIQQLEKMITKSSNKLKAHKMKWTSEKKTVIVICSLELLLCCSSIVTRSRRGTEVCVCNYVMHRVSLSINNVCLQKLGSNLK